MKWQQPACRQTSLTHIFKQTYYVWQRMCKYGKSELTFFVLEKRLFASFQSFFTAEENSKTTKEARASSFIRSLHSNGKRQRIEMLLQAASTLLICPQLNFTHDYFSISRGRNLSRNSLSCTSPSFTAVSVCFTTSLSRAAAAHYLKPVHEDLSFSSHLTFYLLIIKTNVWH